MKYRRFSLIAAILIPLAFLLSNNESYAQSMGGLSIEGYKFQSIWPESFRSVRGSVILQVGNSAPEARDIRNITATAYRKDVPFFTGTCSDVCFMPGSDSYQVSGVVSLCEGISVWTVIAAALSFNPAEYTVDVTAELVLPNGMSIPVEKKGIPVTRFIHR